jgi:hypothetical protein
LVVVPAWDHKDRFMECVTMLKHNAHG